MVHVTGLAFVIVAAALCCGAILQGCIGFGMIVLAFPVLVLVDPDLLPQSALVVGLPIVFYNAWRYRSGADYREVAWLMGGRIPGLVAGIALVALVERAYLAIGGGVVVLAAVALSVWAPSLKRNVPTLLAVGGISALFGTAIAIGGPPLGLLYQHETGLRLRSTISLLMLGAAPISLIGLALTGQVSRADIATGVALMPFGLAGTAVAPRFVPWFDQRLRLIVLSVCASASVTAIVRVLLTL